MHGFEQVKYEVFEGETLNITFKRNVKGTSNHHRLSLTGSITSIGDEAGKSSILQSRKHNSHLCFADYNPVMISLSTTDHTVSFSVTTYSDGVVKGGENIVLEFESYFNNYVDLVEATGEFISHTAVILIIDRDSECTCVQWGFW